MKKEQIIILVAVIIAIIFIVGGMVWFQSYPHATIKIIGEPIAPAGELVPITQKSEVLEKCGQNGKLVVREDGLYCTH